MSVQRYKDNRLTARNLQNGMLSSCCWLSVIPKPLTSSNYCEALCIYVSVQRLVRDLCELRRELGTQCQHKGHQPVPNLRMVQITYGRLSKMIPGLYPVILN